MGDRVLDPGWTSYDHRVLYSTYDVTPLLRSGANAVGVMLGSGWYNPLPLRLFGQLALPAPHSILQLVERPAALGTVCFELAAHLPESVLERAREVGA